MVLVHPNRRYMFICKLLMSETTNMMKIYADFVKYYFLFVSFNLTLRNN